MRSSAYDHEAYHGPTALLPEVPECGRSDQRVARPGPPPHSHPHAFEICLIDRGEVGWWVEDHAFTLSAGQISVTRPGERHGGVGSTVHPCELLWFQVADSAAGELSGVMRALGALPVRALNASPGLRQAVRVLVDEHRDRRTFASVAAAATLQTALVAVVRESSASREPEISRPVHDAMRWMNANIAERVRVADAASAAGLSVARLQARFRAELNTSVGEYWNRLRLHSAKRLLRDTEEPITDIAYRLSFSSSQYFATFFRQRVGVAPSEFRAHMTSYKITVKPDST